MEPSHSSSAPPTIAAVAVRYGLLTGLVSIVFTLILFLTKLDQSALRWMGMIISAGGIYLAHTHFKQHNGGYMEYGQGLGIGTLLSLVSGVMGSIFFYFYVTVVDTAYIGRMMDVTRAQMEAKGNMSDDQIDQAMEMTAKFMSPGVMFGFGLVAAVIGGFVVSLIISAITKNSRPEFE